MEKDIVARLRTNASIGVPDFTNSKLLDEAADEIERLRRELELEVNRNGPQIGDADPSHPADLAEIERLRADNKHWQAVASQGIQIEHELRIEIERLQAALDVARVAIEQLPGKTALDAEIKRVAYDKIAWAKGGT